MFSNQLPFLFQAADGSGMMGTIVMFGLMFVVLYFLMIRPQQKRQKELKNMLESLQPGDQVFTGGGMIGTIRGMDDQTFTVEIASNTHVKFQKAAITGKVDTINTTPKK